MALGLWPEAFVIIPSSLGGLSPILTLMILQRLSNREVDVDKIAATARNWREVIPWLLVAAFLIPLISVLANCLNYLLGFETNLEFLTPGPAELGIALVAVIPLAFFPGLITSPLFEEPAWRGFALPQLQTLFGREFGSLIIGMYWWTWHLMMNISFGIYPSILGLLAMLGRSFIIDSLFNLSKQNILVAMFTHQSMFVLLNFLYVPTDTIPLLLLISLTWITVFLLRIRERQVNQ